MDNDWVNSVDADLPKNGLRDSGVDMIKSVCIILVLIWHLQPISAYMMQTNSSFGVFGWLSVDFLYRYVTTLAVPTLICISMVLFIKKSLLTDGYWKERLPRLILLFLFWTCIQFVFYLLAGGRFPPTISTIIPDGGPGLPYVGGSVFYFLFALVICTGVAAIFLKLSDKLKFIASTIVIFLSCLVFIISSHYKSPLKITEMENYYLYIPIAYYLVKYQNKLVHYRMLFIFGYLLAVAYEAGIVRSTTSAYARLSIVFGVLSLISIVLPVQFGRRPAMEFLSKYCLGIFCLHKYWLYLFITFLGVIKSQVYVPIFLGGLILFITTVVLTFISVYLLGRTKLRKFVS
ncbi:MAG: acyltransferase [Anaerolineaceae bacterium]